MTEITDAAQKVRMTMLFVNTFGDKASARDLAAALDEYARAIDKAKEENVTETTKTKLARYLRTVSLEDMAVRAEQGYYHDFDSHLTLPEMELEKDLRKARDNCPDAMRWAMIEAIRIMHVRDGAFDATKEESDAWAASPEGRAAFESLGEAFYEGGNDNGKS